MAQASLGAREDPWRVVSDLATRHYENFTVGSRLLPRRLRRHLWAVYAYCRTVDDLGDEAEGDRLALLSAWEEELRTCWNGRPRHPVTRALQVTVREFGLEPEPFERLIEANRRDQRVHSYDTYASLLDYCAHSANPVGRIVLGLLGCDSPQAREHSDAVCTALQLTNFWQDVRRDLAKGRVYIPIEDFAPHGYTLEELTAGRSSKGFRDLIAFQVQRTRALFREGDRLLPYIRGRFRIDIALFSMGGRAVLDKIEEIGFDTLNHRPTIRRTDRLMMLLKALWTQGPWRLST